LELDYHHTFVRISVFHFHSFYSLEEWMPWQSGVVADLTVSGFKSTRRHWQVVMELVNI